MFYRAVWVPGAGRDVATLHTRDREEAERRGRALLSVLLQGELLPKRIEVTLGALWDRYRQEAPTFAASAPSTQKDARGRVEVLISFFGQDFEVAKLLDHDVRQYEAARRAGGISLRAGGRTRPVRARSVAADLILLTTMLRWATTVRDANGERWLRDNPMVGIRRPREPNPKRPVATWERFVRTREAMQQRAAASRTESERQRWIMMELALVLAEATGRRLSSIRHLRWDDIDFARGTIRWRAEADKKRRESIVPMPTALADELRAFQTRLNTIAGWLFPRESDREAPMDRHLFDKWLAVAEQHAELPKLEGGLWHPYRRKWASERKHLPLKDVAAAGGWKDVGTLLECYQQPDHDTLRLVMEDGRRLHEPVGEPEKQQPQRQLPVG